MTRERPGPRMTRVAPDATRPIYDRIGPAYTSTRRPDPRIVAAIAAALGDARTLVNVGAGAGAYEPHDRRIVAVEPSRTMIAQRPADSAPCIQAIAERLPFRDRAFDASLAVLTLHHWADRTAGLAELRRVARRRVVLLTWDAAARGDFWLITDYFPEILALDLPRFPSLPWMEHSLGRIRAIPSSFPTTVGWFRRVLAPARGLPRRRRPKRDVRVRAARSRARPARGGAPGRRSQVRALGGAARCPPPTGEPRPRLPPHRRRARIAGAAETAPSAPAARRVAGRR